MKKIWELLKGCWLGVVTIAGALGIIAVIISFYSTLATSADLEKVAQNVEQKANAQVLLLEKKTDAQIQQFRKTMELERDITRLNNVNDNLMRTKQQLRARPRDPDLVEDYEALKAEKIKLQNQIEKR